MRRYKSDYTRATIHYFILVELSLRLRAAGSRDLLYNARASIRAYIARECTPRGEIFRERTPRAHHHHLIEAILIFRPETVLPRPSPPRSSSCASCPVLSLSLSLAAAISLSLFADARSGTRGYIYLYLGPRSGCFQLVLHTPSVCNKPDLPVRRLVRKNRERTRAPVGT